MIDGLVYSPKLISFNMIHLQYDLCNCANTAIMMYAISQYLSLLVLGLLFSKDAVLAQHLVSDNVKNDITFSYLIFQLKTGD